MTNCADLGERQLAALRAGDTDDPGFVDHAQSCEECAPALVAIRTLRAAYAEAPPRAPAGAFERAVSAALQAAPARQPSSRGFWTGLAVGAAAAVALAAAMLVVFVAERPAAGDAAFVSVALAQPREISVAIETDEPLDGAEIHVILRGGIELAGYADERDLRWTADLDRGINELRLPVVANDAGGGVLVVEVNHGGKRKTFEVTVRPTAGGESA